MSLQRNNVCAFIIIILYDAQSILHSYTMLVIYAKIHLLRTKTPLMVIFIFFSILFIPYYKMIDQNKLVMNIQILFVQKYGKHHCVHLSILKKSPKK